MPRLPPSSCVLLLACAGAVDAATYTVGPSGADYTTLNALFAGEDLGPGDLVEVASGNYAGNVVMPAADGGAPGNPVVLRGVGATRPHLSGGVNTIEFRLANHVVFERFEVSGSAADNTFRCVYHHGHDLVLRDVRIHDCPRHGVLGADQDSGSLTIEYSELWNAGSGGGNHLVYVATDEVAYPGAVFRLQYSYLHDSDYNDGAPGTLGGNLIKSRAERNEIYYNWLEGAYCHELELIGPDPNGAQDDWTEDLAREDSDVVGNVIVHTEPFGAIMRFGGDATGQSYGRYRFVANTVIRSGGADDVPSVFRLFDGIAAVQMHDNVFHRVGPSALRVFRRDIVSGGVVGDPVVAGSNNWIDTGSTSIPANWTGTVLGTTPGLVDVAALDLRPAAGSPLLGLAGAALDPSGAYAIAAPRFPPLRHPPLRAAQPPGTASLRPRIGARDIGAFEYDDGSGTFFDGFEQ